MRKMYMAVAFLMGGVLFGLIPSADAQLFKRKAVTVVSSAEPMPVKVEVVAAPAVEPPEATARKTGPVFKIAVRTQLRAEFRKQGYNRLKAMSMAREATDEIIDGLIADAETLSGVKVVGTAIGDGKIIDAIIDFFKSPQGQALIEALIKLILSLLANAVPGSAEFYVLLDMLASVSPLYNL